MVIYRANYVISIWPGGHISNKFTPIRLVVGAWCLLTLVLLNVYNGVLISYVTEAGRPQPLINTFDDVLSDSSILLVLDKGFAGDIVISVCLFILLKVINRCTLYSRDIFIHCDFEHFSDGRKRIVQDNEGQVECASQFEVFVDSAMHRFGEIATSSLCLPKCKWQNREKA
jgi:hypothetical protein